LQQDSKAHILYVDDEEINLSAFKASFRRDFKIFTALSADAAKVILDENDIHVLISDQKMPGTPGIELLEDALKKYPHQVRILLTAYSDFEILKRAVNNGHIYKFITKPWDDHALKLSIIEAYDLYLKNKNLRSSIAEVEQRKIFLEGEIQKLEQILKAKKAEIERFIDNG